MIKPKELRIGNYVLVNGIEIIIRGAGIAALESGYFKRIVEPIRIREKRLYEFGFVKQAHKYRKGNFVIAEYGDVFGLDLGDELGINFEFIHQLQNLYYALTGKEL